MEVLDVIPRFPDEPLNVSQAVWLDDGSIVLVGYLYFGNHFAEFTGRVQVLFY